MTQVSRNVMAVWMVVIKTIKATGDISTGLKYINAKYYAYDEEDRKCFDIISHLLKFIQFYPEYLSQDYPSDYILNENDYLRILWSPIFESLFIDDRKKIRITLSESCNDHSEKAKTDTYHDSSNVIPFKIDMRIICIYFGYSFDLVNGEAASHSGDSKVIGDEGKLTREGKDMIDSYIKNNCSTIFPFLLQFIGSSIDISSIHLTNKGIYVCLPRYNVSLPSNITELEEIVPTFFQHLLTLRAYVVDMSDQLSAALKIMRRLLEESATSSQYEGFFLPRTAMVSR